MVWSRDFKTHKPNKVNPKGWPVGEGLGFESVLLTRSQVRIPQVLTISVLGQFIKSFALALNGSL